MTRNSIPRRGIISLQSNKFYTFQTIFSITYVVKKLHRKQLINIINNIGVSRSTLLSSLLLKIQDLLNRQYFVLISKKLAFRITKTIIIKTYVYEK